MLSKEQIEKYKKDGYLIIEDFLSLEKCQQLRNECNNLLNSKDFTHDLDKIPVFSTKDDESKVKEAPN
jgi:hypothetical protein